MIRVCPAVAAAALAAPAIAAAASPWSAPATVPTGKGDAYGAVVRRGARAEIVWSVYGGGPLSPAGARASATQVNPDGSFGSTAPFAHSLAAGPITLSDGRLAFVTGRRVGPRIALTDVEGSGATRRAHRLAVLRHPEVVLTAGQRGEVAISWLDFRRFDQFGDYVDARIQVALRRPDGRLVGPVTVARDAASIPAIAFDGRGGLLCVYARQFSGPRHLIRPVEERTVSPAGRVSPRQLLGRHDGDVEFTVAVAPNGGAFAVWGTQKVGQEASSPWRVRVAHRAPDASTFSKAILLERGGSDYLVDGAGVHLATAPDGGAAVLWSGQRQLPPERPDHRGPFTLPVRVARLTADGTVASIDEVAPNGEAGDVGFEPDGSLDAAWARQPGPTLTDPRTVNEPETDAVQFAARAPGATTFGPTETIDGGAPMRVLGLTQLGNGRLLASWVAGRFGHRRLRVAARVGA